MNWITKLFGLRKKAPSINGAVVFLDTDILSKEDIERVKVKMTPVFVEFSGHHSRMCDRDMQKSVMISSPMADT